MELKMNDAVQTRYTPLPLRDHTILGVCEAIGEDFGFNPVWLRVPLAAGVLVSIQYSIGAYLLLGLVVLASRLLFPRPNLQPAAVSEPALEQQQQQREEQQAEELSLAA
jgi:phage shock protein C